MKTTLFKTKKLAEAYIRENYNAPLLHDSYITEESDYDTDMVNLQWSGETPAYEIIGDDGEAEERVAWWESGDEIYTLNIGGKTTATFDNIYDAREAYDKASEEQNYEDDPQKVTLLCGNEDISY